MRSRRKPRFANWLLKICCFGKECDSVIGDLTEQYEYGRGSLWYWRQVVSISFFGLRRRLLRRPLIGVTNLPVGLSFTLILIMVAIARILSSDIWMIFLAAILGGVIVVGIKLMVDAEDAKLLLPKPSEVARIDSSKIPIGGGAGAGLIIVAIFVAAFHDQPLLRYLAIPGIVAGLLFGVILRLWRRTHVPKPRIVPLNLHWNSGSDTTNPKPSGK